MAGEPVALKISVWPDKPDKPTYARITESFNTSQTAIKASFEQFTGSGKDYYTKVQVGIAGGTAPDVIYFQGWSWQAYADKKVLAPLDGFIATDKYVAPWPNIQNYIDNTKWDGKTYMSSVDTGALVVYYNKSLFDQFGVPYPKPDWTYAEFKEIIKKMTRTVNGVQYYGFQAAGGWGFPDYNRLTPWMRMDHVLEWDHIVQPKEAKFLQQEIVSALQYINVDSYNQGLNTRLGGKTTIANGHVAVTPEGPWYLSQMYGPEASVKGGVSFDVVPFPKGKTGWRTTSAEVHGHTISKASKNPDSAWALLRYCTENQAQQIIAQNGRMCNTPDTINKIWVPVAQKQFNFKTADVFAQGMESGLTPVIGGAGLSYDTLWTNGGPLGTAWDAMKKGGTAQEALTIANPLVQTILDNYWQARK